MLLSARYFLDIFNFTFFSVLIGDPLGDPLLGWLMLASFNVFAVMLTSATEFSIVAVSSSAVFSSASRASSSTSLTSVSLTLL